MRPTETRDTLSSEYMEVTILGAMILEPTCLLDSLAALRQDDFSLDSHRRIFQALRSLSERGIEVDIIVLRRELEQAGELATIGGLAYLTYLTEGIPRNLNIAYYIDSVKRLSFAREGVKVLTDGVRRLYDSSEDPKAVCDEVCASISEQRTSSGEWTGSLMGKALETLREDSRRVISTGIHELDEATDGGMRTKELWIIGALPSRGKSSLLRQLEKGAILSGESVHTHSIEMAKETWALLHACEMGNIPAWKIRQPHLMSPVDRDRLMGGAMKVEQWPLLIDDEASVSIGALVSKSRLSAMRNKVRVVGIDYIQLVDGEGDTLREKVGDIALRLKQFAKKHDCCVIALSQLARKGDLNLRPTMQDLKESGDLEAHADVILLNYRPVDKETGKFTGEDEVIIAKQRMGSIGSIPMRYNDQNLRFESR